MERIKELNRYQRIVLILLALMLAVFTVLYAVTYSRVGYAYADHILVPGEENGNTIYAGRIRGKDAVFTVTPDQTVTLRYGETVYGPYTARVDPAAIPEDSQMSGYMTGVEILEGDKVFFRGGVFSTGDGLMVMDEDGSIGGFIISYTADGIERDQYGNPIDRMEPSATAILELLRGPELTRKGLWAAWLCGVAVSIAAAVSILFADELFRWHMSFRVSDPDSVYPSDWEIAVRYFNWTALSVMALIMYIVGLMYLN